MSIWNGKEFWRFLDRSLFKNRGTNYRLTIKRLGVLLLAILIYLPAELLIWIGFGLDEIFFAGYKKVSLPRPVFIIGNPRSGTTFLQRVLAWDRSNFHCMRTWEIFLAPSVSLRRAARFLVRIGRAIGVPISRRIREIERLWKESDRIHRLKLRSPEEDEYLFIHNFSTMKIWSFAAIEDQADPYIYFDQQMPAKDKRRMMDFYQGCIQRHYHYHQGHKKLYLSKNPNFSPAVETLLDRFPDARFIYLVRDPLEAVPSHISLKDWEWHLLGSPLQKYACRDFIIRSSKHWYAYPLEKLRALPENQAVIVRFQDLVADARSVVERIYRQFGLPLSGEFLEHLRVVSARARNHESDHKYSLAEMGITRQALAKEFAGVRAEFSFEGT